MNAHGKASNSRAPAFRAHQQSLNYMGNQGLFTGFTRRLTRVSILVTALLSTAAFAAPIPPAEKLLPEDTLLVVTAPDFSQLRTLLLQSPTSQLWRDPAMKPFRDKVVGKWEEDFAKPLERDLDIRFADYRELPQGQLTFAISQNGWEGQEAQEPAFLFLLDAKDKSAQLKKNLTDVRKKWVDAGKSLRTEKVRDVEFAILTLNSNDVPKTLRRFFSSPNPPAEETEEENTPAKAPEKKPELAIGQFESLLILGDSLPAIEKVVARLTGGSAPVLADVPAFEADRLAHFRDVPLFGWANANRFLDVLGKAEQSQPKSDPDQTPPLSFDKILRAVGVSALKTLAFSYRDTGDGTMFQLAIGAPASARVGLLQILAVEPKTAAPPPFVPADATKFQRMRLDGQKAWKAIEKSAAEISPQFVSVLNMFLQTADKAGKESDPGFDIRKDLIGNLGDDVVIWEKTPTGDKLTKLDSAPSILLIGSPNAEKLGLALRNLFASIPQTGGAQKEREFLGRKIFSATLPMLAPPEDPDAGPGSFSFAASGGYLGFSTDTPLLEEWLRSSETPPKPLCDKPGLTEVIEKAGGAGGGWLIYEDQSTEMRALFELFKKDPGAGTNLTMSAALGLPVNVDTEGDGIQSWFDVSLLPAWDSVAKYFHYGITSGSATADGLTYRFYSPTPPGLKK